jgi:hypothetical protein
MKRISTFLFAVSLCGLAAVVPSTAGAATQTINFDDFTAPSDFGLTAPLTTRYQPQGATFSGPAAGQGGAVLNSSSNFEVSGFSPPNFLAFSASSPDGYPIGPETVTFASPVSSVSLKVGAADAGTVTLAAFDGATSVATSNMTKAPALAAIAVAAAHITSVRLSYTGPNLVADDLQYDVLPLPPASPTPNSNGTLTPSNTVDKTKPTLDGLSFSTTVFAAAKSGASTSAKKKTPVGTKVSFTLSEASSVRFTVQRKTKGRKVGKKCKAGTHANRKKKPCTLWKNVKGSFIVAGKAGKNTFKFRGRVGGKKLRTGSYRLNGTATDPAKNASVPKRKGFTIVK